LRTHFINILSYLFKNFLSEKISPDKHRKEGAVGNLEQPSRCRLEKRVGTGVVEKSSFIFHFWNAPAKRLLGRIANEWIKALSQPLFYSLTACWKKFIFS